jgi:hypothetical protein
MGGEIARIVERAARIGALGDADQIENGKRGHGELLTGTRSRCGTAVAPVLIDLGYSTPQ